jgi:class 3 adenylate cyclase/tetratricopeptide (TPR) repeat protein
MNAKITQYFNSGDLVRAYDLCLLELRKQPEDLWLRHRAVLCLIGSGALERARAEFQRYDLASATHDEDCRVLDARLAKAEAFEASPKYFKQCAATSARRYLDVFDATGGHYPGINAATMMLLAGEESDARQLAGRVLDACQTATISDPEAAYYQLASQSEALLLLGDIGAAHISLRQAIAADPNNYLAHAVTLRQFRIIADELGFSAPWLGDLHPPRPAHVAGHLFALGEHPNSLTPDVEARLVTEIADAFERENVGMVYGALAAGADILFAEGALRRGSELRVVLPVPVNVFIAASVRPLGAQWVARCEACLDQAEVIHEITSNRKLLSELHIRHSSEIAMGMARVRADVFATTPVQLLVWDEEPSTARCGTAHDADVWAGSNLHQVILPIDTSLRYKASAADFPAEAHPDFAQKLRAMLFIDVRGSSGVPDDRVPAFVENVLGRLAEECRALAPAPLQHNSWGDGIFLTFESAPDAARAAVDLQRAFARIDLSAHELPQTLALRIGGHFGPVFEGNEPLREEKSIFGGQVNLAARIEPRAAPGSILVSEAFSSVLAMEAADIYRCEYVGTSRVDPNMPRLALYSLRGVAAGSIASLSRRTSSRISHPA